MPLASVSLSHIRASSGDLNALRQRTPPVDQAAVTLVAEIGDFGRFASPRQLMAWLALVPKEHSSGRKVARADITKAGNARARRILVEGAWTYRLAARMGEDITRRHEGLPETIKAVAWKAQYGRARRLTPHRADTWRSER